MRLVVLTIWMIVWIAAIVVVSVKGFGVVETQARPPVILSLIWIGVAVMALLRSLKVFTKILDGDDEATGGGIGLIKPLDKE